MLKIIGTTHFDSKEKIEGIIKDFNPDIIGVELCLTRFKAFTNQLQTSVNDDSIIGKISEEVRKKAELEKVEYGSDMKTAMFFAINNNITLALLDKDINEIRDSMQLIPQEEMIYLQNELLKFKEQSLEKEINEEEVIEKMKKDIPNVFKILVEERNEFIVNKIKECVNENQDKRIIVFIGKGHTKKINELLEI